MPSNTDFTTEILIAGVVVPEYEKDGKYFIECNLNTSLTYMEKVTEIVQGDRESQEYPVTPYHIKVTSHTSGENPHYFRIMVDGLKIKGVSLDVGQSKVIRGFRDGPCVRELLFSMPRFARDETDRLNPEREASIGKIEVQCWSASLKHRRLGLRYKQLQFQQANKKDSTSVTHGQYIMATSRAGRKVCPRSLIRSVDSWKLEKKQRSMVISYHMQHTLRDLGFTLRPLDLGFIPLSQTSHEGSVVSVKREGFPRPGARVYRKRRTHEAVHRKGKALEEKRTAENFPAANPQEAVEALLALCNGSDDERGALVKPRATSGPIATSGSILSPRDSIDGTQAHDAVEAVADYDEMEIVEVVLGRPKQRSKTAPLIDLTMDSGTEDTTEQRSKLDLNQVLLKGELKQETSDVQDEIIEASMLDDVDITFSLPRASHSTIMRSHSAVMRSQSAVMTSQDGNGFMMLHDASETSGGVEVELEVPSEEVEKDTIEEHSGDLFGSAFPSSTQQSFVNTISEAEKRVSNLQSHEEEVDMAQCTFTSVNEGGSDS